MEKNNKVHIVKLIKDIVSNATARIAKDLSEGRNIDICLDAFNYWQDEERSGINYIFDIQDSNDLKYLVSNDLVDANMIAAVVASGTRYFQYNGKAKEGVETITDETLISILIANSVDYMLFAVLYVGRCGEDSPYANIYEEYITNYIEDNMDYIEDIMEDILLNK